MNPSKQYKFWLVLALFSTTVSAQVSIGRGNDERLEPQSKLVDAARLIEDIRTLSADEMEGRSPAQPSIQKARDYVEKRFKESGLEPVGAGFRHEFEIKQRQPATVLKGVNIVGSIKGGKNPNKHIVITAHYDHEGTRNRQIYNGADDNASGTAALFAIASYFKKNQPDHSLIFAAFDAEEMGLQGARHFVANLPIPKGSILLNVNMDMLSRNDKGELYTAGASHYPQLRPPLERVQKSAKVKLLLGHDDPKLGRDDWTSQSDHAAFHAAKIPFVYFGVEDHADYHKPTDDFANIQPEFYVRAVETVVEAVRELDKATIK